MALSFSNHFASIVFFPLEMERCVECLGLVSLSPAGWATLMLKGMWGV